MKNLFLLGTATIALTFCNLADKLNSGGSGDQRPSVSNQAAQTPKPTPDRDAIKTELLSLANDMAEASKNGDITFLSQNTTDDFVLTDVEGKVQNKNKALADVKEERSIRSWAITNGELASASENDAVLTYTLSVTLKTGQSGRARVTDTFEKQGGKWLLKSEQQTMVR